MKIQSSRDERGFTLIELMIVVAIIGILAAVAIPKFADMLRKSKEGATKGSLTSLRSAVTIYQGDNDGTPPLGPAGFTPQGASDLVAFMTPKYVESIPSAKLGTYHIDSNAVDFTSGLNASITFTDFTSSRAFFSGDTNGWIYTSLSGQAFWVNCQHTDTKNNSITLW